MVKYSKSLFEFIRWISSDGWQWHQSGNYWYKSKRYNQWPPEQIATDEELYQIYFGD